MQFSMLELTLMSAGMADYWKQHYNTPLGRGTVEEFISNYQRHVGNHAFCVQIENSRGPA
jgi:hypothetical protein